MKDTFERGNDACFLTVLDDLVIAIAHQLLDFGVKQLSVYPGLLQSEASFLLGVNAFVLVLFLGESQHFLVILYGLV